VKVEIWDIVDKGKKRDPTKPNSLCSKDVKLKMHNHPQQQVNGTTATTNSTPTTTNGDVNKEPDCPALDAEFVDVYKGTNGVVFLFDMTKSWTFEYVQRELRKCPLHIPILILANHRDMGHHRAITDEQVKGFIECILGEDHESGRTRTGQIRHAKFFLVINLLIRN